MTRKVSLFVLLTFSLLIGSSAFAQGPIDTTGTINDAPYRIVVPANWNGTLLVYAHGYRDKADHPGEVDNRNPDIAPNSALATALLAQGFALAGSAYRDNGWEVEGGIQDTKDLAVYFRENIAKPEKTIIWAFSMGTVIGFKSMERFAGSYDGALCAWPVGAGATSSWDAAGDLALAYDTVFEMGPNWGTFYDVRDDIDFETEVQPKLIGEVTNPLNYGKFEFLRLVSGTPGRGIVTPAPPAFYPGWLFTDMFFTMEARSELERRAGGPFVQTLDRNYSLTDSEFAYLAGVGVLRPQAEAWLDQMDANRNISAPKFSRNYVEHNANYNGKIKNPVLTLHTQIDPLVTVSQEYRYAQNVGKAGKSSLLYQSYTNGNGHCNFTGPQLVTALGAITSWVNTGVKPTQANFPAGLGFLQNYSPPDMNQP